MQNGFQIISTHFGRHKSKYFAVGKAIGRCVIWIVTLMAMAVGAAMSMFKEAKFAPFKRDDED